MLADAHVISLIPVTDPKRSKDFYADVLGLEFVADDGFAMVFRCGERWLRLTTVPELTPHPFSVIGWEVADIAATVRGLTERRVAFTRYDGMEQDDLGIWTVPGEGTRVAWFVDPDGNVLSVVQPGGAG